MADKSNVQAFKKCFDSIKDKKKVEFLEINKIKMDQLEHFKSLMIALNNFPSLMYLTVQ